MMMRIAVVGGGLAGTFLAARLGAGGASVMLFDEPRPTDASFGAAGLYNIFTGLRAVQTWRAEELLAALNNFFDEPPFRPLLFYLDKRPIFRPFKNVFEQNEWSRKDYGGYARALPSVLPNEILNPLGGLEISGCGRLRVAEFISALKDILTQNFGLQIIPAAFDYARFDPITLIYRVSEEILVWDALVFAQGVRAVENPYFRLPIIPLKGQTLTVSAISLSRNYILSGAVFAFETERKNVWKIGSTYERNFTTIEPTSEGVAFLLDGFAGLRADAEAPAVLETWAAARPTTADRRPILGAAPDYQRIYFFNGLGTKGVLLAPFFSKILAEHILKGTPLPDEVDIKRFFRS